MDKLIDLNTYPVSENLKALLKDKTTKKNIIFATSVYSSKGTPIKETEQMTEEILKGFTQYEIQPRVLKNKEQQQERTRAKAEVFTPSWICNKMNNHCDEEWFGRKDVFNVECEQGWLVNTEKVEFDTADEKNMSIPKGLRLPAVKLPTLYHAMMQLPENCLRLGSG